MEKASSLLPNQRCWPLALYCSPMQRRKERKLPKQARCSAHYIRNLRNFRPCNASYFGVRQVSGCLAMLYGFELLGFNVFMASPVIAPLFRTVREVSAHEKRSGPRFEASPFGRLIWSGQA